MFCPLKKSQMKVLVLSRGIVSFQHLHGGIGSRHFRQDVIVPPGSGTFLIRIYRQIWVCFEMLQLWSNEYTAEGREEPRYWDGEGSGLV